MTRRAGNEADEMIRRRDDTTISSGAPGHYLRLPPPYRWLARDAGASATLVYTYIYIYIYIPSSGGLSSPNGDDRRNSKPTDRATPSSPRRKDDRSSVRINELVHPPAAAPESPLAPLFRNRDRGRPLPHRVPRHAARKQSQNKLTFLRLFPTCPPSPFRPWSPGITARRAQPLSRPIHRIIRRNLTPERRGRLGILVSESLLSTTACNLDEDAWTVIFIAFKSNGGADRSMRKETEGEETRTSIRHDVGSARTPLVSKFENRLFAVRLRGCFPPRLFWSTRARAVSITERRKSARYPRAAILYSGSLFITSATLAVSAANGYARIKHK